MQKLADEIASLPEEEQWAIISDAIIRLMGQDPPAEITIRNDEQEAHSFIVPSWKRFDLVDRPEDQWRRLEERVEDEIHSSAEYQLKVNDEHLKLIIDALDFYSRIGCGQFTEIEYIWRKFCWDVLPGDAKQKQDALSSFAEQLSQASKALGEDSRQPISSKKIAGRFGEMYDIQKTLQKACATANDHWKFSVWCDGNVIRYGKNRLVEVAILRSNEAEGKNPPAAETDRTQ